jgi:ribonuclease HI
MNRFGINNFKSILINSEIIAKKWPESPSFTWISERTLFVATDGSCINNGQKNAVASWGFIPYVGGSLSDGSLGDQVLVDNGINKGLVSISSKSEQYLGASIHTNNTGELTALGRSFRWAYTFLAANNVYNSVIFLSDSTYSLNGILGLQAANENASLIGSVSAELDRINRMVGIKIAFVKVKGHSNHKWNVLVDLLAKSALPLLPSKPPTTRSNRIL